MTDRYDEEDKQRITFVPHEEDVRATVRRLCGDEKYFTVADEEVKHYYPGIMPENNVFVIERTGERIKTLATVEEICRAMTEAGMTRDCTVVAYGGGVVGDIAGFAASIYMRGVGFKNVPTTLLSQIDSAIGGKTGVNLDGYKNMIGSFHMPSDIIICPELLGTLPDREWRSGMGELIKTALLKESLFDFVGEHIGELMRRSPSAVNEAVKEAALFKADITDADPHEHGGRIMLNLGHTVGHALEKCDCHRLSHGEYVMLGLAVELKMTEFAPEPFVEVKRLLKSAGLPKLPKISVGDITSAAKVDKKNREGGDITVSGLKRIAHPFIKRISPNEFTTAYEKAVDELIKSGDIEYA